MVIAVQLSKLRSMTERAIAARRDLEGSVGDLAREIAAAASEGDTASVGDARYEVVRVTWSDEGDVETTDPEGAITLLRNGALLFDPRPPGYEGWFHFGRLPAWVRAPEQVSYDLEWATADELLAFRAEAEELITRLTALAEPRMLEAENAVDNVRPVRER
jgi:hypothetical protein